MSVLSYLLSKNTTPIDLYSSEQVYAMEQAWFAQGYDSFALMQQAAWQVAQHIEQLHDNKYCRTGRDNYQPSASIWVGSGNNGGDGWLVAHYLRQAGWQVQVVMVGLNEPNPSILMTDALKARQMAILSECEYVSFGHKDDKYGRLKADVYIDAIFGIGLNRAPTGVHKAAIMAFNQASKHRDTLAIAIDVPSGLVASTGQVFDQLAVHADITLCLIARKLGLHIKDGMDHSGEVIDIPLIPYANIKPSALLLAQAYRVSKRRHNSYKGSYGHVLIIGGNCINDSQGMGGAAILAAASTMATGAGKITVACHKSFHGALLTSLPDAMTIDLHDKEGVKALIEDVSVLAIGMGLGRDQKSQDLFVYYLQAAMSQDLDIVIDADGLYHLASLRTKSHDMVVQLQQYSVNHKVCMTPHSGEAALLLNKETSEIESNRLHAIKQGVILYGGDWVLKGAGSMVLENGQVYVCATGNSGMASAGMGDVLSGVAAGLLAQIDMAYRLRQAVLIHGLAGDMLVSKPVDDGSLLIGQRGLQAQDMPAAIRHVIQTLTH